MGEFSLLHTTLYAKCWYQKGDIWEDLKVMLTLDDYNGELMRKGDVVSVILTQCQLLDVRGFRDLLMFASGIDKDNAYKNGYQYQGMPFQKEGTTYPEWDYYESIIRYCMSILKFVGKDKIKELPRPDYIKGLSKRPDITPKDLNRIFGKLKKLK